MGFYLLSPICILKWKYVHSRYLFLEQERVQRIKTHLAKDLGFRFYRSVQSLAFATWPMYIPGKLLESMRGYCHKLPLEDLLPPYAELS